MGMKRFPTVRSARVEASNHVKGNSQPWYAISPGIPETKVVRDKIKRVKYNVRINDKRKWAFSAGTVSQTIPFSQFKQFYYISVEFSAFRPV